MRALRQRSVQEYRAGVARCVLRRMAVGAVPSRAALRPAGWAVLMLLAPVGLFPTDRGGGSSDAAVIATPSIPDVVIPRIVADSMPGGAAHSYASRAAGIGDAVIAGRLSVPTIEDAWSAAFFGDRQRMTDFIERSAAANDIPADFLLRLLKQESGLNHQAVSRAGAQGVAQFMPATAGERGLLDPFNPFEAIPKSAELLKEYRTRFGSLGLAAAAYNAGPRRVRDWLQGRSALPRETRDYVTRITGRPADDWRNGGDGAAVTELSRRP
ncbi:lytic transglycosylase domain-containing protein [Methylobacterium sp. ID0610]|uniref:lytic transglycosylase domain-containing protein n=1 Tax=Methylobacterium carpenticola TaxID=3344827 RepID=UPI00369CBD7B